MGAIAVPVVMGIIWIWTNAAHHAVHPFNAPIPEQCRTFEQANSPEWKSACDDWFASHRND